VRKKRLLLPFTTAIDKDALAWAVQIARNEDAILVLLALIRVPQMQPPERVRYEDTQQARDFLEAGRYEALKYQVPIERYEIVTDDSIQSIDLVMQQMFCDKLLLFVREDRPLLLTPAESERLLAGGRYPFSVVRLPPRKIDRLLRRLRSLLPALGTPESRATPSRATFHVERPSLKSAKAYLKTIDV
jgi:hypothetical protein